MSCFFFFSLSFERGVCGTPGASGPTRPSDAATAPPRPVAKETPHISHGEKKRLHSRDVAGASRAGRSARSSLPPTHGIDSRFVLDSYLGRFQPDFDDRSFQSYSRGPSLSRDTLHRPKPDHSSQPFSNAGSDKPGCTRSPRAPPRPRPSPSSRPAPERDNRSVSLSPGVSHACLRRVSDGLTRVGAVARASSDKSLGFDAK